MPIAPLKPCAAPGCGGLTANRYCARHAGERPQYDKDRKEHHRFYAGRPWRRLRAAKLKQDPICEVCKRELAVDVHHKIDRRIRPDLALAWDNLQSLGHACHSRETAIRRAQNRRNQSPRG